MCPEVSDSIRGGAKAKACHMSGMHTDKTEGGGLYSPMEALHDSTTLTTEGTDESQDGGGSNALV